ncbi:MAG TPA: peptide ABC transporter substrate-binding protein [Ktedonobacterales bacterium]|jgi:peptide/nickel transport system substrate-binding protein/oligopeptide transport system substrate-binding protein
MMSRWQFARIVVLLGTLALLLAGCDLAQQTKQLDLAKDQTLKMVWSTGGSADITTLDPAQCADTTCIGLVAMLFDGLVALDSNEHVKPWGAQSWTVSLDGLTYIFKLQPNQRFSDGTPVKPSDYAWSIDRSANPCLGSSVSYYLAAIKDASAFNGAVCDNGKVQGSVTSLVGDSVIPDDSANTLTIKLARPAGYFLAALTNSTSFALEKSVVTGANLGKDDAWLDHLATGATGQGGSGMFYVSAWNHQGTLTLKRNPNWWGTKPHFTEVDFTLFASSDVQYSFFQKYQTQAFTDTIPPNQIAAAKKLTYYHEQPALITLSLKLNWKLAPFDDINARKAFCLAINRDQVNQQVYHGLNIPGWHIVPKGMDGYNARAQGIDGAPSAGDTALAQQYWQRYLAAHHNSAPPIALPNRSSGAGQAAIALYQQSWKQALGVQVTTFPIRTVVENPYSEQLSLFGWTADYPDPQDWLTMPFATASPFNSQSASVPDADNRMRQADMLSDTAQRIPLYNQAEQLLINSVAVCPLYQYVYHYALRPWVKGGFVEDAGGVFTNDAWVTGYIAKH